MILLKRSNLEPLITFLLIILSNSIPVYTLIKPIGFIKLDFNSQYSLILFSLIIGNFASFRLCFFDASIDLYKPIELRYHLILRLILSLMIIITLYATIYLGLYSLDKNSFNNPDPTIPLTYRDYFYFSTVTFATVGYGDIYPKTSIARDLVSLEILNSILILVILIANFDFFKSYYVKKNKN